MATTLLLQNRTLADGSEPEVRHPQKVGVFDAGPERLLAAVREILPRFGAVGVIPAIAHEANMKRLLVRDLAEAGVSVLTGDAEAAGTVLVGVERRAREPQDGAASTGEVFDLAYAADLRA